MEPFKSDYPLIKAKSIWFDPTTSMPFFWDTRYETYSNSSLFKKKFCQNCYTQRQLFDVLGLDITSISNMDDDTFCHRLLFRDPSLGTIEYRVMLEATISFI